jgi:hypothetical protein
VKPLQWIGVGLLVVGVHASINDYDLLVDPLGWLLALVGVRRLAAARDLPLAGGLTVMGVIALLCSIPLWWPTTLRQLDHGDPGLLWGVGLAELVFQLLLCRAFSLLAREARADGVQLWMAICQGGLVLGIGAPVAYFAAHQDWLNGVAAFGQIVQLLVIILCFVYAGRPWAGATPPPDADDVTGTPG